MDITFFKPKEVNSAVKLTVHRTGKLGFSKAASGLLDLENNKYCKIGVKSGEEGSDELFMMVQESKDEYTYRISKAGDYYYVKAKQLLNELNIDYKRNDITTIYDIEKEKVEGNVFFKLTRRIIEKRKAK
jgi:hypothetical protein